MYFLFCFWWLSAWGGCDELNTNSRSIFYHNDNHIFAESREYRYCLSLVFNIVLICLFGMGEKMTKSFDEWFEEKYLSLSIHANAGFEKDLEVKNIAKSAFTAGAQSKQAEVDGLQLKLSEDSRVLHNVIDIERRKCEKLQKRIDEAMKYVSESPLKDVSRRAMINFMDILKGGSHES